MARVTVLSRTRFDWRPWAFLLAAGALLAGCHFGHASVSYYDGYSSGGYYRPYYGPRYYYAPHGYYRPHHHYRHYQ